VWGLSTRRRRDADASIVATARALRERRLVVGSVGNVSVRADTHVRITPSRVAYDDLRPSDLVTVDTAGRVLEGTRAPSLELRLHLAIYAARPDVGAVVHTHSPRATAWSFLGEPLPDLLEEQSYYGMGPVSVSRRSPPGSPELARAVVRALAGSPAALIGSHGVVAVGADCDAALAIAEVVEQTAHVAWLLRATATRTDRVIVSARHRACI
jgi:L-fuculose-phosphate aldolase